MEYVQMTLDDWVEMKQKLKLELLGVKQSFVRIGYMLRKMDDQKLYEQDGYKTIAEFAKAEYGLEASTVSRFMSINREYSIDGYSERLRPEYADLGRSQLEEMLKLPESDREMIRSETSREDIRELKRFNKTEPGEENELAEVIEKFFEANPDTLNDLYQNGIDKGESAERLKEIVNPAGNKSFRKGIFFLMMYKDVIKVKKFGADPRDMPWEEFFEITRSIFDKDSSGGRTWSHHFGEAGKTEPEKNSEEKKPEKAVKNHASEKIKENPESKMPDRTSKDKNDAESAENENPAEEIEENAEQIREKPEQTKENVEETEENPEQTEEKTEQIEENAEPEEPKAVENHSEEPTEEAKEADSGSRQEEYVEKESENPIAPAQKTAERLEENGILDHPEIEEITKEEYDSVVHPERPFGTRKKYTDTLTEYGMAEYLAKSFRAQTGPQSVLSLIGWERWLTEKVDGKGRTIE